MPKIMTQEEYNNSNVHYNRYVSVAEGAIENDHKHWIEDSIPALPELVKFYNEFKFKRRNIVPVIVTAPQRWDNLAEATHHRVWGEIGIAYKSSPEYVVGKLCVGLNNQNKGVYVVQSDLIQNEKFAPHKDGYHRKVTGNFAAAVKNAVIYIKPMTLDRLAGELEHTVDSAMEHMKSDACEKLNEVGTEASREDILSEVTHMIAAGYTPVTAHFAKAIKVMQEQGAELRRIEAYSPRECWVWGRRDGTVAYQFQDEGVCEVASIEEVPEFVRDKIAVLQISEANHAVMDVGVRLNDKLYCVFV